jgi:hypothetical protein
VVYADAMAAAVAYLWTYLILNVNLVQQDATIQDVRNILLEKEVNVLDFFQRQTVTALLSGLCL